MRYDHLAVAHHERRKHDGEGSATRSDKPGEGGSTRRRFDQQDATDQRLQDLIIELLARVRPGASICPSEVARALAGDGDWRRWMEAVRQVAGRLQRDGRVVITQKGRAVDPDAIRGPIRFRLLRGC
jgi:hypothetical protein